jgi:molybdopterin molybdotransferase
MIELEVAQGRILSSLAPLDSERIPLNEALGRYLAEPVIAPVDLPPFDNSAMDGYAVRGEDLRGASASSPVALRLRGTVAAGEAGLIPVESGACVRVFTGSPLPPGADAVVMQEDTRLASHDPALIQILDAAKPWENVRLKGEDVRGGVAVAAAGDRVTAGRIGMLAAVGCHDLAVHRRPVLGIIATGNELREPGQKLAFGQIYESNRIALEALARQAGAKTIVYPLVPDTHEATEAALRRAFAECDGVVTSGGVSVGAFDFVKGAFEGLGGQLDFWRVAIKPGKPFVCGRWQEKWLFGVPGNPVSAFVTFLLLVRPALLRWQGARHVQLPVCPAELSEPLVNRGDRRHFVRVALDERGQARPAGPQASHLLRSLAAANGLVDVPPGTTWPAGSTVSVIRTGD